MQKKQRKLPQTWIMYKMGRNFLGDIIWQDTSLCKVYRFTIGKIFSDLQFDILFKINIVDFFFLIAWKLHEYATLIQYLYIASLLSWWLFFSKLLTPRRSQGTFMIIKYIINLTTTFIFGKSMYIVYGCSWEKTIQSWTQGMIDTKIMSTLSYDDRSPNPATQIMPL